MIIVLIYFLLIYFNTVFLFFPTATFLPTVTFVFMIFDQNA